MEKLVESYKTLTFLLTQIFFFKEIHETFTDNEEKLNSIKFKGHYANQPFAKSISGNHLNYMILLANGYLDEYHDNFTAIKHPDYAERITEIKKLTKPVVKRIGKWTNLKDYRNNILAHNFRVKGQSIFASDFEPIHLKAPHTNSEIMLLAELLSIINTTIIQKIPGLLAGINFREPLFNKITYEYIEVDIEKELNEIKVQMLEIDKSI